jgi:glycosyltransferase involved in cell wall biosynthesis
MKVAIIGTVGVPASYGGLETLAENLLTHKNRDDIEYRVYCSSKRYKEKRHCYKGARLIYLPLDANGFQSIPYDALSIIHAICTADKLLVLGNSGCIIMPLVRLLSKKKICINIDGLEHRRAKWGKWAKRFLKLSEKMAVRFASVVIADNKAIQDYVRTEYAKKAELIAYGGDNAFTVHDDKLLLDEFSLHPQEYCFMAARIEPENNVEMIIESFKQMPDQKLVIAGRWETSSFGEELRKKYQEYANIKLLDAIYDSQKLSLLRSNCKFYVHGHSAGGTNPSLVEAMAVGLPVVAYDVIFNRETTENKAAYFKNVFELKQQIQLIATAQRMAIGKHMAEIAQKRYTWSNIAAQYESCLGASPVSASKQVHHTKM